MQRFVIRAIALSVMLWSFINFAPKSTSAQSASSKDSTTAANAWIWVPTPVALRTLGVAASLRAERDRFWDQLIGASEPLTKQFVNAGISHHEPLDKSEIPRLQNRAILTATFTSSRSILSATERSVYTEVSLRVDKVFAAETGAPAPGRDLTLCVPGGTVIIPPKQVIPYITGPRTPFIQPGRKYLLVLSHQVSGDFYLLGDDWDITDGKTRPNSNRTEMISNKGLSTLNVLSTDELAPAISRLLAAENR